MVFLASEMKKAHERGNARASRRLRRMCGDRRRRSVLFANEHCRATAVRRRTRRRDVHGGDAADDDDDGGVGGALDHPVLRAAAWYAAKVRGAFPVVVLSDDDAEDLAAFRDGRRIAPPGVEVLTAGEYFPRFHGDDAATSEMYESARVAAEDAAAAIAAEMRWGGADGGGVDSNPRSSSSTRRFMYPPHLPAAALAEGVERGDLLEGVLRISRRAPSEAVVRVGVGVASGDGEGADADAAAADDDDSGADASRTVLVPTRRLMNRALDGDVVAVRRVLCTGSHTTAFAW